MKKVISESGAVFGQAVVDEDGERGVRKHRQHYYWGWDQS